MAFQTNVYRGGEWRTETIDVNTIVKANKTVPGSKKPRLPRAPQCGLLTRTVVESTLIHFILPVRLRGPQHNDVAFIADHEVRIQELGSDGRLREVARKCDFRARIRNACVVGSFDIREDDDNDMGASLPVKIEGDEPSQPGFPSSALGLRSPQFPPQLLMLVLECGDSVFLFLRRGSNGRLEFITSRFPSPRDQLVYPGFHLTIDPSSRYAVLACAVEFFVVYELETIENLRQAYLRNEPLNPVKSYRPRSVQGVIHKIDFLYPRPGDDNHIILLLIVVRAGKSRMVIYEWKTGDDLRLVFAEEKTGHRMPVENQMPVLLIPLTVKSAFIAISPGQVAVCTGGLYGPPNFETVEMHNPPATQNHHGRDEPLWTAWARPFRLSPYFKSRDCIYLAREDGVVIFIEADSESALDRSTFMDTFDSNISTAFTCLFDQYTDVLLLGSDSGPGAIWKVPARQPLELLDILPNWSPTVDFVTTDEFSTWNQAVSEGGTKMQPWKEGTIRKPDRIFATSGHEKKGSIAEYRYGLKAGIGLDLDYGAEIRDAWIFPSKALYGAPGFHLILSMPDSTAVLQLSEDFSQAQEPVEASGKYDLSSPTLAVAHFEHLVIQITTEVVLLMSPDRSARLLYDEILPDFPGAAISDAAISGSTFALSAHTGTRFCIHVLEIDWERHSVNRVRIINVNGDVTSLFLGATHNVLAGVWRAGQAFLGKSFPIGPVINNDAFEELEMLDLSQALDNAANESEDSEAPLVEAITSVISAWGGFLLGTRSGQVIKVTESGLKVETFGTTAAKVSCHHESGKPEPTVLVSCDKSLVLLRDDNTGSALFDSVRSKDKLRVWPVDASNPASMSPPVDYSVAVDVPFESHDTTPILIISGTKILLAELQHQSSPVPRYLPVEGTPTRVIYSEHLQCLVAAVNKDGKPTLMFIDPDTGEDLGRPIDKKLNTDVDFISGLGKEGDRIHGLTEWRFEKDRTYWRYILVSTKSGRMIVVSTTKEARENGPPLIRYWMQFQRKGFDRPVYSVIGFDQGLIYCVGQTVYWDLLDTVDKKLVNVKTFELGSPATCLSITNGKLIALTSRESLEIIEHNRSPEGGGTLEQQIHVDPRARNAIHMIEVAGTPSGEQSGSVVLLADRDCGVNGLWIPWQTPGRECEVVLEAELPTSIRKFRRGRTRPVWEQGYHGPKYGRLASTVDDAEILGVSLDGSLYHLTMLNLDIWRLLRFIQNVAVTNEELSPFTHKRVDYNSFDPEPVLDKAEGMQVDGDMLRRCLEKRALERLLSWPDHESRFFELLRELEDGRHTAGLAGPGAREQYFKIAYDILDYFLRPVL